MRSKTSLSTLSRSTESQPPASSRRKGIFVVAFVVLLALAVVGAWTGADVFAEVSLPQGQTIPPGGTIPMPDEPDPGKGQVNVIHLAPTSANVIDTGVQLCDAQTGSPVTSYLYYQQQTGYMDLDIGTYEWYVATAGTNCADNLLALEEFLIGDGSRLTLLLFGDDTNQPLDNTVIVERLGMLNVYLPVMEKN